MNMLTVVNILLLICGRIALMMALVKERIVVSCYLCSKRVENIKKGRGDGVRC